VITLNIRFARSVTHSIFDDSVNKAVPAEKYYSENISSLLTKAFNFLSINIYSNNSGVSYEKNYTDICT